MMLAGVYDSYEMAFYNMLRHLMMAETVAPRGMKTKEQSPAIFFVSNPSSRLMLIQHRNGNPFATIAETLWMISGRNDLDWLERYIPQCKKWSDDGKIWRAAYGPRLRCWRTNNSAEFYGLRSIMDAEQPVYVVDQVYEVVELLKRDPETRQAVISLWNPGEDWIESKDIPCNNWLHFIIRGGKLHLNTAIRSNDIWFGFSHCDFFGWSYLQQLVAHLIGVEVGAMTWNATSFHIYESHWEKAQAVLDHPPKSVEFELTPLQFCVDDLEHYDELVDDMFNEEERWRTGDVMSESIEYHADVLSTYWDMLWIYNFYLERIKPNNGVAAYDMVRRITDVRYLAHQVSRMEQTEAKYMAIEYLSRHIPGFNGELKLSEEELRLLNAYSIIQ